MTGITMEQMKRKWSARIERPISSDDNKGDDDAKGVNATHIIFASHRKTDYRDKIGIRRNRQAMVMQNCTVFIVPGRVLLWAQITFAAFHRYRHTYFLGAFQRTKQIESERELQLHFQPNFYVCIYSVVIRCTVFLSTPFFRAHW